VCDVLALGAVGDDFSNFPGAIMNTNPTGGNGAATADPFSDDLSSLRISQDFGAELGVKKQLTIVRVKKPDRQWFARVHPDPQYRLETYVVELKDERETYLVRGEARLALPEELTAKVLFLAITRQGIPFIWPVKMPDATGRLDEWNRSLMMAAKEAESAWVSVKANRHAGAYEIFVATGNFPDPVWPDKTFSDLLRIAFKDKVIDSPDHAVIQQLLGAL
jgi:hypothetical protein